MWQHGFGFSCFQSILNTETRDVLCELNLIDLFSSVTHTTSKVLGPNEAWLPEPHTWFPTSITYGYGWGFVTSTGSLGTMYAWGAQHSTIDGKIVGLTIIPPEQGISGRGYIPMWQHGYGATYVSTMINTHTDPVTGEMTLIDVTTATTYTKSAVIGPMEAYYFDTGWGFIPGNAFGWGYMTSTGPAGTAFCMGTIYNTLVGKINGLTIVIPKGGF